MNLRAAESNRRAGHAILSCATTKMVSQNHQCFSQEKAVCQARCVGTHPLSTIGEESCPFDGESLIIRIISRKNSITMPSTNPLLCLSNNGLPFKTPTPWRMMKRKHGTTKRAVVGFSNMNDTTRSIIIWRAFCCEFLRGLQLLDVIDFKLSSWYLLNDTVRRCYMTLLPFHAPPTYNTMEPHPSNDSLFDRPSYYTNYPIPTRGYDFRNGPLDI
jgi:hypothetical protein